MSAIRIGRPPRQLEGVVAVPSGPPRGGAVVCHPHPQMGGDMENPVVLAVADTLRDAGLAVVRFNFGGVGRSEGTYSGGPAEVRDVIDALAALDGLVPPDLPRILAGYSFGAWAALRAVHAGVRVERLVAVAPPLAFLDWSFLPEVDQPIVFVVGDRDPYCPSARLAAAAGGTRRVEIVPGADHFFSAAEDALRRAVARAVSPAARTPECAEHRPGDAGESSRRRERGRYEP